MCSKKVENKIKEVVETALNNVSSLIDVNTIIGTPIKTEDNEYIFPVSTVLFSVVAGGGEYGKVSIFKNSNDLPYSAGNGTVVSIKPCGFLIKTKTGEFKMVNIGDNSMDYIVEKALNFIDKIRKEN